MTKILLPIALLLGLCQPVTADEAADNAPTLVNHSEQMTIIHNNHRARAGLRQQARDERLSQLAQQWAEQMARSDSMYHGPNEQVIAYSWAGNVTYEQGFKLWLNSPPHRAWIFGRNSKCGFGYARSRSGKAYYAGVFGDDPKATEVASDVQPCNNCVSGQSTRRRWLFGRRR